MGGMEAVITGLTDDFKILRRNRKLFTFITAFGTFLVALLCITKVWIISLPWKWDSWNLRQSKWSVMIRYWQHPQSCLNFKISLQCSQLDMHSLKLDNKSWRYACNHSHIKPSFLINFLDNCHLTSRLSDAENHCIAALVHFCKCCQ